MRQRAVIAAALANSPSLLIADELTSALDAPLRSRLRDLLLELRQRLNMSLLAVSHDLGWVSLAVGELLVMYGGSVGERGSTKSVIHSPLHQYTGALSDGSPSMDRTLGGYTKLSSISGTALAPHELLGVRGCPFSPRCPAKTPRC